MAKLSLDKFAGGALREQTITALQKVAANISDPNTSETAARTVTIVLKIHPDEDRRMGEVEVSTNQTLQPVKSARTKILIGYNDKTHTGECAEFTSEMVGQINLEPEEETNGEIADNIKDFRRAKQ